MSQNVTIVGPNLRDQSKGQFHVHATGCEDLRRNPNLQTGEPNMEATAESIDDVVEFVYEDHMAEHPEGGPYSQVEGYLGDFHFAPCVRLARRGETQGPGDLEEGQFYLVRFKYTAGNYQTVEREMNARFMAREGEKLLWDLRPLAGTTDIPDHQVQSAVLSNDRRPSLPRKPQVPA